MENRVPKDHFSNTWEATFQAPPFQTMDFRYYYYTVTTGSKQFLKVFSVVVLGGFRVSDIFSLSLGRGSTSKEISKEHLSNGLET